MPVSSLTRVVLPAPFSPMTATVPPAGSIRSTSRSTGSSAPGYANVDALEADPGAEGRGYLGRRRQTPAAPGTLGPHHPARGPHRGGQVAGGVRWTGTPGSARAGSGSRPSRPGPATPGRARPAAPARRSPRRTRPRTPASPAPPTVRRGPRRAPSPARTSSLSAACRAVSADGHAVRPQLHRRRRRGRDAEQVAGEAPRLGQVVVGALLQLRRPPVGEPRQEPEHRHQQYRWIDPRQERDRADRLDARTADR